MKKILYFDWFSAATEWYRMIPLDYLKSDQFTITRSTEQKITFATINDYDIIIISRPSSWDAYKAMLLFKDQKKYVIIDFDDDCLHVDERNPMHKTYEDQKPNTLKCIALADEIWVATDGIKKSFRLYNKNIHVIPNAWNDTVFPVKEKKPFTFNKIAMWRGGHSHIGDIYAKGTSELLVNLINSNKLWSFYWLGQKFEWVEERLEHPNFYYHEGASTVQFYKLMQSYNPCLFFYPLKTTLFNSSKSNCSWLESTYSGAAYFGNMELPEIQKPGVMDLNEVNSLIALPDKKLEKILAKNHRDSWSYIEKNLLLSIVNKKREERLLKI